MKLQKTTIDGKTIYYRADNFDAYVIKDLMKGRAYTKLITLNATDRWLDAGSNIGIFAVDVADKVDAVISYEPELENCTIIKKNTKKFDNVSVVPAMVGDKTEARSFYLGKTPMSYSGLIKRGRTEIKVPCVDINDIIVMNQINCLKLDIEGSEYEVIKAITPANWKKINQLVCEFHLNILRDIKTKEKYNEIISILKKHFTVHNYKVDTKGAWHAVFYFSK